MRSKNPILISPGLHPKKTNQVDLLQHQLPTRWLKPNPRSLLLPSAILVLSSVSMGTVLRVVAFMWLISGALTGRAMTLKELQDFLAHPPPIERIVYDRTLEYRPIAVPSTEVGKKVQADLKSGVLKMPKTGELYSLKYQHSPPGYILRRLLEEADVEKRQTPDLFPCNGRFEEDWWWVEALRVLTMKHRIETNWPQEDNLCVSSLRAAHEIVRLGMFELITDSVSWNGNSFAGIAETGEKLTGSSKSGHNGQVDSIVYKVHGKGHRQVSLNYDTPLPLGFPSRVEISELSENEKAFKPYALFRVHRLSIANSPMPREAFSPKPLITTNHVHHETTMNGPTYLVDGTNRIPVRHAESELAALLGWGSLLNYAVYAIVGATVWITFRKMLKRGKRT